MIHALVLLALSWAVLLVERVRLRLASWSQSPQSRPGPGDATGGDACPYCSGEVDFDRSSHPSDYCIRIHGEMGQCQSDESC